MDVRVILTLSRLVAERAQRTAERTQRPVEAVLADWLDRTAADLPVEELGDEDLVALCEQQMPVEEQTRLSTLLADHREGCLDEAGERELERLMREHDRALLRKSQALREAVARGLRQPLAA